MPKNHKLVDDKLFPASTNKQRKVYLTTTSHNLSTITNITTSSAQEDGVEVIVHLDCKIGSKLLSIVYKSISKVKLNSTIITDNNIYLSNELIYHTKHNSKSSTTPTTPQLIYRGGRDGFKGKDFHSKCCNQGPTLTIIKSSEPPNQIFGGFTSQNWKSSNDTNFLSDDLVSAFIFKIENTKFRKFRISQDDTQHIIHVGEHYLTEFGRWFDSCIGSDCDLNNDSCIDYGHSYALPTTDIGEFNQIGGEHFYLVRGKNKLSEIEVFKITTTTTIQ